MISGGAGGSIKRAGTTSCRCPRLPVAFGGVLSLNYRTVPLAGVQPLLQHVLDFCYPDHCPVCSEACPDGSPHPFCDDCHAKLAAVESAPACERCAKPLAYDRAPCPYCAGRGWRPYERVVALGIFNDPLKHLVHRVKYHRQWPLAEVLADRLLAQERAKGLLTETDVLVPVPLHPIRHIARGYNQAELIARRLAWHCDVPVAWPVVRVRHTETQTHIRSRAKRVQNLRDAFGLVDPRKVAGKHVVVVDDVTTTGATLRAFARALQPARPASISALVLAIADPRGKDIEVI